MTTAEGHVTPAGCHMAGTLQVGVAEEVQAFLDKIRAKRKGVGKCWCEKQKPVIWTSKLFIMVAT